MEQIIAESYLQKAKQLIQHHIMRATLSDSHTNQLANLYEKLDLNNSEIIYNEALSIIRDNRDLAIRNYFRVVCFLILAGGILLWLSTVGHYGKNSYKYKIFSWMKTCGCGLVIVGIVGLAAIGH